MTEIFRMPTSKGTGLEMIRYENECFANIGAFKDPPKCLEYSASFKYTPDDILICGYPKSGSHWIGNMVWKLKSLVDIKRPPFNVLAAGETDYDIQEVPRIIHSHLKPSRLPTEHLKKGGKMILILRNPKDVCVSFYHHLKTAEILKSVQTFDEYFQSFLNGDVPYASYFDFIQEWENTLHEKTNGESPVNVEVFYYEDCKENPMENIQRLNTFLNFGRDQVYLQKVLELTQFVSMKEENADKEKENAFNRDSYGKSVIYRRGDVGDWKNIMTAAQSEIIDRKMTMTLTKNVIKFK